MIPTTRRAPMLAAMLLLAALLLVALSSTARAERLPTLESDYDRVGYLLHLRRLFPQLFQDAARHDTDLLSVLEAQQAFEERMRTDRELVPLVVPRRPLLSLDIVPAEAGGTQVVRVLSPEALGRWRASLVAAIPAGTTPLEARLVTAIRTEVAVLTNNAPQSFLNGLLSTIPADRLPEGGRGAVFRMPLAEQLRLLGASLPENLSENGFRAGAFTLPPGDLLRAAAIRRFEALAAAEARLTRLAQAHFLLQGADGALGDPARLEQLGEGDLDVFFDRTTFRQRNARLATALGGITPEALQRIIEAPIGAGARRLQQETVQVTVRMSGPLRLVEIPPQIAIFRGAVGGDCGTSHSSLYANAPNERIFLLVDGAGNARGYVAATHVVAAGEPALYVHTINGKNVSQSDAETIFQALHERRAAFGVRRILLTQNIGGNMNYGTIQAAFRHASRGGPVHDITYPDAAFRDKIAQTQSSSYDTPSNNPTAVEYVPPARPRRLTTTTGEPTHEAYRRGAISVQDALLFAIDLARVGSTANARRVLAIPELNLGAVSLDAVLSALDNADRLPMREYYDRIGGLLRRIAGIAIDRAFFEDRLYLFRTGHLASAELQQPNALAGLTPVRQRHTLDFVLDELRNEANPRAALAVLSRNTEWFAANERFQAMVNRLLAADATEIGAAPPEVEKLKLARGIFEAGIGASSYLPQLRRLIPLLAGEDFSLATEVGALLGLARGWTAADVTTIAASFDHPSNGAAATGLVSDILTHAPTLQLELLPRALAATPGGWERVFAGIDTFAPEVVAELVRRLRIADHAEVRRILAVVQLHTVDLQVFVPPLVRYFREHGHTEHTLAALQVLGGMTAERFQLSLFSPAQRELGDALLADLGSTDRRRIERAIVAIEAVHNRDAPLLKALAALVLDGTARDASDRSLRDRALQVLSRTSYRTSHFDTAIASLLGSAAASEDELCSTLALTRQLARQNEPEIQARLLALWERLATTEGSFRLVSELLATPGPMPRELLARVAAKLATGNTGYVRAAAEILRRHPPDPEFGVLAARALSRAEGEPNAEGLSHVVAAGLRRTETHDALIPLLRSAQAGIVTVAETLLAAAPNLSTAHQVVVEHHFATDVARQLPSFAWETVSPEVIDAVFDRLATSGEGGKRRAIDMLARLGPGDAEVQRRLVAFAASARERLELRNHALRVLAPSPRNGTAGEPSPAPRLLPDVVRSLLELARPAGRDEFQRLILDTILPGQDRLESAELVLLLTRLSTSARSHEKLWPLVQRSATSEPAVLTALARAIAGGRTELATAAVSLLSGLPEIPPASLRELHQATLSRAETETALVDALLWFDERAPGDEEIRRQREARLRAPLLGPRLRDALRVLLLPGGGALGCLAAFAAFF